LRQVCISCLDVHVLIQAKETLALAVLKRLEEDFQAFQLGEPSRANIIIGLQSTPLDIGGRLFIPIGRKKIAGWFSERIVLDKNGDVIVSKDSKSIRRIQISAANFDSLLEKSYLSLLSSLGELLEKRGYLRAHALCGSYAGIGFALHFSSGMGKSSLAFMLAQDPQFKLLGDEVGLIRHNRLWSFPLRLALTEKVANELGVKSRSTGRFNHPPFSEKLVFPATQFQLANDTKLDFLFYGLRKRTNIARVKPFLNFFERLLFIRDFSIGLHLPQIAELAIRGHTLFWIPAMIFARFRWAILLLWVGKVKGLEVTSSAPEVSELLIEFLKKEGREVGSHE
jgi:hypothetical protein